MRGKFFMSPTALLLLSFSCVTHLYVLFTIRQGLIFKIMVLLFSVFLFKYFTILLLQLDSHSDQQIHCEEIYSTP